jgi:hypothetical protein
MFQEVSPEIVLSESDFEFQRDNEDLAYYWGTGLNEEDYAYLEKELSEWKKTHRCDTKAEESLLREICLTALAIRKERAAQHSPKSLVKDLQDLMKTASVDPAKTAQANSGKSLDTYSSFIKIIETKEPAEYYKDKMLFRDFDKLDKYFKDYVTRPLKNFVTQSRDFNVEVEEDSDETLDTNEEYSDGNES